MEIDLCQELSAASNYHYVVWIYCWQAHPVVLNHSIRPISYAIRITRGTHMAYENKQLFVGTLP